MTVAKRRTPPLSKDSVAPSDQYLGREHTFVNEYQPWRLETSRIGIGVQQSLVQMLFRKEYISIK